MYPVALHREPDQIHYTREHHPDHIADGQTVEERFAGQIGPYPAVAQQGEFDQPDDEKTGPVEPHAIGILKNRTDRMEREPVETGAQESNAGRLEKAEQPDGPLAGVWHGGITQQATDAIDDARTTSQHIKPAALIGQFDGGATGDEETHGKGDKDQRDDIARLVAQGENPQNVGDRRPSQQAKSAKKKIAVE